MERWRETNWFAVQAKPHRENLAAASVANLDLEVFLPRIRQEQLVCGFERWVVKPLFTGYFFAKFSPALMLDTIRYARGVLRVVGCAAFPIPLEEEIISAIQERVEEDGFVRLKEAAFQPGDRVTIEQGPLAGWMGQVERHWDDGKRVAILLEAIQQSRVLVERRWLAPAADAV
jgi:transcriptional antiterminator RfaH